MAQGQLQLMGNGACWGKTQVTKALTCSDTGVALVHSVAFKFLKVVSALIPYSLSPSVPRIQTKLSTQNSDLAWEGGVEHSDTLLLPPFSFPGCYGNSLSGQRQFHTLSMFFARWRGGLSLTSLGHIYFQLLVLQTKPSLMFYYTWIFKCI